MKRNKKYIFVALHAIAWSGIFLLPFLFRASPISKTIAQDYPAMYYEGMNVINAGLFYFNAYVLAPIFLKKKKWIAYSFYLLLLIIVAIIVKLLIIRIWFVTDEWTSRFAIFSTLGFSIISTLYSMAVDAVRLEREQKEILAEKLYAELKFYRSQINPHFLFNVMSTLISLGRKRSEALEPTLITISELMRYTLYETNEKKVPIVKEIEYLRNYIDLQQLRFKDEGAEIESQLDHPDDREDLMIEPMLLIPFVENAFKHGIGWVKRPSIKIALSIHEDILYFTVQNKYNEKYRGHKDDNFGIGLNNVQSRLKLLYKNKYHPNIRKENSVFYSDLKLDLK